MATRIMHSISIRRGGYPPMTVYGVIKNRRTVEATRCVDVSEPGHEEPVWWLSPIAREGLAQELLADFKRKARENA